LKALFPQFRKSLMLSNLPIQHRWWQSEAERDKKRFLAMKPAI
jgi:hypothetical protein